MQATIEKESPRVVRVQLSGKMNAAEWSAALRGVAALLVPGEQIAVLVAELRRAVADEDPAAARAEVERLTLDLEAHLTYEEQELIPLLDATA